MTAPILLLPPASVPPLAKSSTVAETGSLNAKQNEPRDER